MWFHLFRAIAALIARIGARRAALSQLGRIAFTGLIRNRALGTLTHQQVRNALAKVGMREAHNAHFISRLISRGPSFGINTLDDFARAINSSVMQRGRDGTIELLLPNGRAKIILNRLGELVTLTG